MEEAKEVRQIPIEDIIPNRFQPRLNFDEKALNELAESIKQHGIIQPLVLRPLGDKFEIIAGERRYKAATLAGLRTVPGIVTEMDDNTSAEVALIENVQRKDLSSIEEAKSYKSMLERSNMTQEELAKKMGLSQSTIANKLRLLNLSEEVQSALTQEKISERHARALLAINNKEEQVKWLNRIINERLTVRQLDLAIKDEMTIEKEFGEDIPKVNINPDIESIINNAVDINSTAVGVPNSENTNKDRIVEETKPNKFFNYLEDQEVNMNINEDKKEENKISSDIQEFSFSPEFIDAPENKVEEDNKIEEIEVLDDTPVVPENINVVEEQKEEPIFNIDNNSNDIKPVEELEMDVVEEVKSEPVNDQAVEEIISEKQEPSEQLEELVIDEPVDKENQVSAVSDEQEEDITIEPIPIMEGEGIVDPVSFFDTLDPKFMDKIKEFVGLDLKNAINSYRDLTTKLNEQGFKITIDETDLDNKYYIEININKE